MSQHTDRTTPLYLGKADLMAWIKKYMGWIVAGVGAFLAVLFCVRQEKERIAELQAAAIITRTQGKIKKLKRERRTLDTVDALHLEKDRDLDVRIKSKTQEISAVRARAKTITNAGVVAGINELYHNG